MWQMGLEYCDAIVYQAKVHQAKKVYEEDAMTVEDSVKSAMSPFLVLEVRRDHLIEDTLVHVKLKVSKNIFRYLECCQRNSTFQAKNPPLTSRRKVFTRIVEFRLVMYVNSGSKKFNALFFTLTRLTTLSTLVRKLKVEFFI